MRTHYPGDEVTCSKTFDATDTMQIQIDVILEGLQPRREADITLPREFWDNVDRHIDDEKL